MKRIIFLLLAIILSTNFLIAQEISYSPQMPTDEQILQVIEQYDFPKEQKEQLLKETKQKLKELYSPQNQALLLQTINSLSQEADLQNIQNIENIQNIQNIQNLFQ